MHGERLAFRHKACVNMTAWRAFVPNGDDIQGDKVFNARVWHGIGLVRQGKRGLQAGRGKQWRKGHCQGWPGLDWNMARVLMVGWIS